MSRWILLVVILLRVSHLNAVGKPCRELLTCSLKKDCVKMSWLEERMNNAEISGQMYDDLDTAIDYPCIFSSGCPRECTACPLCHTSKRQLVEVLTGSKVKPDEACNELVNCAMDCVANSNNNFASINRCLRYTCAYHCFDGSCPKCSAFITKGSCTDLLQEIVHAKFRAEFEKRKPRRS